MHHLMLVYVYYLYILSLPSGFKYNNIYVLLFIVVLTVNSILFTSGFLDNIILSSPLHIILIVLVVLYLLFIMFNLYIRLYNVLFRALSYHICKKYDPKSNFLRLCTYYYLYNIEYRYTYILEIYRPQETSV